RCVGISVEPRNVLASFGSFEQLVEFRRAQIDLIKPAIEVLSDFAHIAVKSTGNSSRASHCTPTSRLSDGGASIQPWGSRGLRSTRPRCTASIWDHEGSDRICSATAGSMVTMVSGFQLTTCSRETL